MMCVCKASVNIITQTLKLKDGLKKKKTKKKRKDNNNNNINNEMYEFFMQILIFELDRDFSHKDHLIDRVPKIDWHLNLFCTL